MLKRNFILSHIGQLLVCMVSAVVFADVLRLGKTPIVWLAIALAFDLILESWRSRFRGRMRPWDWRTMLFSAILSASVIFCRHMQIDYDNLYGSWRSNYNTPFTLWDVAAFCLIWLVLAILVDWLAMVLPLLLKQFSHVPRCLRHRRWVLIGLGVLLFLAWLPYFLAYYPGIICGDSNVSIEQALGRITSNHFPVVYTLFIRFCLWIGMAVADATFGCAIYTLLQMICLSLLLAYIVRWLWEKGAPKSICILTMLAFAFCGTFPQSAIIMWKDPVFSVTLAVYSLKLYDFAASNGACARNKTYLLECAAAILIICFSRNNGLYIVLFSLLLTALLCWRQRTGGRFLGIQATMILIVLIVTGPVYSYFGITDDSVEKLGIPIQQLARVVVYDGEMDEEEAAFLDSVLPLEEYKELYTPGTVDSLKWAPDFDNSYMGDHAGQFVRVWLNLLRKNFGLYVEAWCWSTYGYWSLNTWELNAYDLNIVSSGYKNSLQDWNPGGIQPKNLLQNNWVDVTQWLSLQTPTTSLGLSLWLMLLVGLLASLWGQTSYALLFIPCIGNVLTLLVASPICYWPRYGLAGICLLPVTVALPWLLQTNEKRG